MILSYISRNGFAAGNDQERQRDIDRFLLGNRIYRTACFSVATVLSITKILNSISGSHFKSGDIHSTVSLPLQLFTQPIIQYSKPISMIFLGVKDTIKDLGGIDIYERDHLRYCNFFELVNFSKENVKALQQLFSVSSLLDDPELIQLNQRIQQIDLEQEGWKSISFTYQEAHKLKEFILSHGENSQKNLKKKLLHAQDYLIQSVLHWEYLALLCDISEAENLRLSGEALIYFVLYRAKLREQLFEQFKNKNDINDDYFKNSSSGDLSKYRQDILYLREQLLKPKIKNTDQLSYEGHAKIFNENLNDNILVDGGNLEFARNRFYTIDANNFRYQQLLHQSFYYLLLLINKKIARGVKLDDIKEMINELEDLNSQSSSPRSCSNKERLKHSLQIEITRAREKLPGLDEAQFKKDLINALKKEIDYQKYDEQVARYFKQQTENNQEINRYIHARRQQRLMIAAKFGRQKWEKRFRTGAAIGGVISALSFSAEAYFFGQHSLHWILSTIFRLSVVPHPLIIGLLILCALAAFVTNLYFSVPKVMDQAGNCGRHLDQGFDYFRNSNVENKKKNLLIIALLALCVVIGNMSLIKLSLSAAPMPVMIFLLIISTLGSLLLMSDSIQRKLNYKASEQNAEDKDNAQSDYTWKTLLASAIGFFGLCYRQYPDTFLIHQIAHGLTHVTHLTHMAGWIVPVAGIVFSLGSLVWRYWQHCKNPKSKKTSFVLSYGDVFSLSLNLVVLSMFYASSPVGWAALGITFLIAMYCFYQSLDKKYSVGQKIGAFLGLVIAVGSSALEAFGTFKGIIQSGFESAFKRIGNIVISALTFIGMIFFYMRGAREEIPKAIGNLNHQPTNEAFEFNHESYKGFVKQRAEQQTSIAENNEVQGVTPQNLSKAQQQQQEQQECFTKRLAENQQVQEAQSTASDSSSQNLHAAKNPLQHSSLTTNASTSLTPVPAEADNLSITKNFSSSENEKASSVNRYSFFIKNQQNANSQDSPKNITSRAWSPRAAESLFQPSGKLPNNCYFTGNSISMGDEDRNSLICNSLAAVAA
ncbi:MAG: hypothetical protein KIT27_07590 [Legionellales bacterium]|nr:hypothetical protein [Legionellales bacterium]